MFNLIDAVKGVLTPEVTEKLGALTGNSGSATTSALGAIVPAVGAGIINKGSTPEGASDLLRQSEDSGFSSSQLGNLGSMFSDRNAVEGVASKGQGLLSSLFGKRLGPVSDLLASRSGLGGKSTSMLMAVIAPLAMGLLGKHAKEQGLGASGISGMLSSQKGQLTGMLPKGLQDLLMPSEHKGAEVATLGAAGVAGAASLRNADGTRPEARDLRHETVSPHDVRAERDRAVGAGTPVRRTTTEPISAPKKKMNWPLIGAAVVAALLLLFVLPRMGRNRDRPRNAEVEQGTGGAGTAGVPPAESPPKIAPGEPSGPATGGSGNVKDALGKFGKVTQRPDGVDLTLAGGDLFASGANSLLPGAERQLGGVAETLKTNSGNIRIEGHTDATGSQSGNQTLSNDRAEAVKTFLVGKGVAADRISAVGLGDSKPIADNTSPEGRAQNRRVEIIVTQP